MVKLTIIFNFAEKVSSGLQRLLSLIQNQEIIFYEVKLSDNNHHLGEHFRVNFTV